MEVIKQIITVPASREICIKLPDEAATNAQAEIIVLYESVKSDFDEKLAAMRGAATDEMFMSDLREAMTDFERADFEHAASEAL